MLSSAAPSLRFILFIATGIVLVTGTLPTWQSLIKLWTEDLSPYAHGMLALVLALLHCYHHRHQFSPQKAQANWLGLAMLFTSASIWFVASFLQIQVLAQLSLLPLIYATAASLYGLKHAFILVPALLYLLLAMPVMSYINNELRDLTTVIATTVLQASGLTVFIEGNFISIPYGTFEVADGCSGLRYFLTGTTLAIYFSQQGNNNLRNSLVLIATAILFSLFANWLRVILIILIGFESEMQSSIVHDHQVFGWVVFAAVAIPAFKVLQSLEQKLQGLEKNSQNTKSKTAQPRECETSPLHETSRSDAKLNIAAISVVLSTLITGPMLLWLNEYRDTQQHYQLRPQLSGWFKASTLQYHKQANWKLDFEGGTALHTRLHNQDKQTLDISAVYYHKQAQGQELVGYHNQIADIKNWTIKAANNTKLKKPKSRPVLAHIIQDKRYNKKLVYSYYQIGEQSYIKELNTKLAQLKGLYKPELLQAYIAFAADCRGDCIETSRVLSKIIDEASSKNTISPIRP